MHKELIDSFVPYIMAGDFNTDFEYQDNSKVPTRLSQEYHQVKEQRLDHIVSSFDTVRRLTLPAPSDHMMVIS